MKNLFKLSLLLLFFLFVSCQNQNTVPLKEYPESLTVSVQNDSQLSLKDAIITVPIDQLKAKAPAFNPLAFVVLAGNQELSSQVVDSDGDRNVDQVLFLTDFVSQQTKEITVRYSVNGEKTRNYPKRTQAELSCKVGGQFLNRKYQGGTFQNVQYLRVPPEHTDHSFYIRYEGPGWESDKIAYRFYLDWRNAIDITGKKIPDMVLQNVGLDGFESYHSMSDWGMDVLKVGESLGIGSIAMWTNNKVERVSVTDSVTCQILSNGSIYSQIQTRYYGWKVGEERYNLTSDLSIIAGSRLTKNSLLINGEAPNLCTGIVKLENADFIQSADSSSNWSYIATYGKQSLANDNLGMAVLFQKKDFQQLTEDSLSHVVVLKPTQGKLDYYLLAAWEQEPNGIKNKADFTDYLNTVVQNFNHPLIVTY
jgi:hypothetical protein